MDNKTTMLTFRLAPKGNFLIVSGGEMIGEKLIIPAKQEYEGKIYPVKEIGDSAFSNCDSLKYVIMNGVTIIGHSAFEYCNNLEELHFSEPITEIGCKAFLSCRNLKDFGVPIDAHHIGNWAFAYCEQITSISLSNRVYQIGECAFYKCSKLERINIPDSVHSIGAEAFGRCSSLSSIIIPDSVTYTGKYVFMGCESLRKVYINKPEMLRETAIPEEAEVLQIDAEYFDNDDQKALQEFTNTLTDTGMEIEKILELAWEYYDKGYRKRGFALYKKAAELGSAKAQHLVAFCYYGGLGTKKDKTLALEWYKKAAEQEYPQSVCYLADFYAYGIGGVERDTDEAVRLWKKAAELGDKEAPFILGNLYYYGKCVEQDQKKAVCWYRMSAQRLNINAIKRMQELGEWIFSDNENDEWFGKSWCDHPIILLPND